MADTNWTPMYPPVGGLAIVPSDVTLFARPVTRLLIGTAGTLSLLMIDGSTVAIPSGVLPVNVVHQIGQIARINSTGTTATGLIGFYN